MPDQKDNPSFIPCCPAWLKAHEDQTDNESFLSLIWYVDKDPRPYTSSLDGDVSKLPPLRFCPWCGGEKFLSVSMAYCPH